MPRGIVRDVDTRRLVPRTDLVLADPRLAEAERMLEAAGRTTGRLAFGTHDLAAIRHLGRFAAERGIPRGAFEFQMLYGIQREEQVRLAAEGFRVRVLISYGRAWFPWYMRRLAERPANLWFVLRSAAGR